MAAETVVVEFQGDASGLKPLADALKALGQLTDEQIKAFNDATKAAENFGQKSAKATKETEKSAEELNKSFKEFQEGIIGGATEEFAKQMKGIGLEATKATETSKKLTTQLRELKNQLATLPEGSKEFKKVAIEAAKLEDKIGDVSKEVRILASDSLALDTMTGIARGIAGGFALAQGAAALFGKENEDVQKALLKVNAAMAILQGLQEVSLVLRREEVVRVGIAAAAQKAYAFVVGLSTGAMKAFRLALASIGIGAVIAGIALLVTYWEDIAKYVGLATGETKKLGDLENELIENEKKRVELQKERLANLQKERDFKDAEVNAIKGATGDTQRQIELLKAQGGAKIDILKLEQRLLDIQFGQTRQRLEQLKFEKLDIQEAKKEQIELEQKLLDLANQRKIKEIEIQNAIRKPAGESIGELPKIEPSAIPTQEIKIAPVLDKETMDAVAAETERIRQEEIDAEKAKQEAIRDNAISIAQETFDTIFAITSERRNAEYEAELAALNKEKEAKLANKKLTDGQRAAIEAQYRKKEAKIKEEQFKKDKASAIVQALINGALAIATTIAKLGAPPSPAGIAGLAAVAASTALSVATIAAQPIPKFAKGTKNAPEGLALVGEQGAELVHLPQGSKVIPHPASMKILDGHIDSEKILSEYNIKTGSGTLNIDYQKLASELGKELGKHPKTTINVDENGLRVFIQSENHRVERLEKRYASK